MSKFPKCFVNLRTQAGLKMRCSLPLPLAASSVVTCNFNGTPRAHFAIWELSGAGRPCSSCWKIQTVCQQEKEVKVQIVLLKAVIIYWSTQNPVLSKSAGVSNRNKHVHPHAGLKGFPETYYRCLRGVGWTRVCLWLHILFLFAEFWPPWILNLFRHTNLWVEMKGKGKKGTGTLEESLFLYLTVVCPLFYRERGIIGDWTANVSHYFKMNLDQSIIR